MIEVELGALAKKKKRVLKKRRPAEAEAAPKPRRLKKRVEEDAAPKRKLVRRKKVTTEPEKTVKKKVTSKKKRTGISVTSSKEERQRELERLKAEAEAVIERIPATNGDDAEQLQQYRHMFDKLVDIAEILENNIVTNRNGREVYPLMQTYNQIREVIADMRALRDVGAMGATLNDEVIGPMMQSIAQDTVDLYQDLLRTVNSHLDPAQAKAMTPKINQLFSRAGTAMQRSYESALEKSQTVLGG